MPMKRRQAQPRTFRHRLPTHVALTASSTLVLLVACTAPKADQDSVQPPAAPTTPTSCTSGLYCDTLWVPGGEFPMGFSPSEIERPEDNLAFEDTRHPVWVSGFYLDRFEVSRERFQVFSESFAAPPAAGAGAHPRISDSGWQDEWNRSLPLDRAALERELDCGNRPSIVDTTDTAMPPTLDASPTSSTIALTTQAPTAIDTPDFSQTCLSWFVAFAFCAWDGGRLPTEAEWEYAAAGGALDRPFPWGEDPTPAAALNGPRTAIGSNPALRGAFGHDDLAGGVYEWTLDWFSESFYQRQLECSDCANLDPQNGRSLRGGRDSTCCGGTDTRYRSAARNYDAPGNRGRSPAEYGVRCARDVDTGTL
jgi:formylglycine-generating enzyme